MIIQNKTKESRYFVALVPPEPILGEVMNLKEEVRDDYKSKAALNSPAHITLLMPFRFKEKKEEDLRVFLADFSSKRISVPIEQNGFGCFSPRVIFVNVALSESLFSLQKDLSKEIMKLQVFDKNYKNQVFQPHMTIAFRDLRKPKFFEAWEVFRERAFHQTWSVSKLSLLKHNGERWEVHQEFALKAE